jgi:hypothetical protein
MKPYANTKTSQRMSIAAFIIIVKTGNIHTHSLVHQQENEEQVMTFSLKNEYNELLIFTKM